MKTNPFIQELKVISSVSEFEKFRLFIHASVKEGFLPLQRFSSNCRSVWKSYEICLSPI